MRNEANISCVINTATNQGASYRREHALARSERKGAKFIQRLVAKQKTMVKDHNNVD